MAWRVSLLLGASLALAAPVAAVTAPQAGLGHALELLANAKAAMPVDPKVAATLADSARAELEGATPSTPRTIALAQAGWLQGEALIRLNEPKAAQPIVKLALTRIEGAQPLSKLHGDLLQSRAGVESALGSPELARRDYQAAFELYGRLRETRSQAIALQNIGLIYQDANDFTRVLYYYTLAADLFPGDPQLALSGANNKAMAYAELGRAKEARVEYGKALKLAEAIGNRPMQARILNNLANAQLDDKDYPAASHSIARGMAEQLGAGDLRPALLRTAARLALEQGDARRAVKLLGDVENSGVSLSSTQANRSLRRIAYQAYKAVGDDKRALRELEGLRALETQGNVLSASTNSALMTARFDFANQNARIANLKTGQLQRDIALTNLRNRQTLILLGSLLLLGAITVAFLIVTLVRARRSGAVIQAAYDELHLTNVALERALQAKTTFLATTSHEIRTPLNGVLGMTQVLLADPQVAGVVRERIGLVHSAGETMRALVDDILDLAKLDSGEVEVNRTVIDLPSLLAELVEFWRASTDGKTLVIELEAADVPRIIVEDMRRIRQILFNLLSNAVKFTLAGKIVVRAGVMNVGGSEHLSLAVADTGIGIPADSFEAIFEKFHQLDAGTTRQFSGTGLGLSISQSLAQVLGGRIDVTSMPGIGSTFTLLLPLHRPLVANDPLPQAPFSRAVRLGDCRLVVAGASPIAKGGLRAVLEKHVGTVATVDTLAEVQALAAAGTIDLILIDGTAHQVQGEQGFRELLAFCAGIREYDLTVLLLWTDMTPDDRDMLISSGGTGVIGKPVSGQGLLDAIRQAFERKLASCADAEAVSGTTQNTDPVADREKLAGMRA
jgi:signal transduction histidine kinase/DNA-binding NarL/FixJ family response regulator